MLQTSGSLSGVCLSWALLAATEGSRLSFFASFYPQHCFTIYKQELFNGRQRRSILVGREFKRNHSFTLHNRRGDFNPRDGDPYRQTVGENEGMDSK